MHAYWTTLGGEILRGSLASGEVTSLASPGSSLGAITLDGSYLYGADSDQIFRVPKVGGALESLAPGAFEIVDLEVVGDSLFALDYGSGILSGRLYELSPSTGLIARFEALEFPRAIAADDSDVFVIGNGALIAGEALLAGVLLRLPRATFAPQVLATQIRNPFGVHILGDAVLYGVGSNEDFEIDARLLTVPRSGGDSSVLSQLGATGLPVGLAADSSNAYVTLPIFSFGGGPTRSQILRAPLAGGLAEVIFERIGWFFVLPAVTSSHVATTGQLHPPEGGERERANVFVICK